ncbi:MAG TPA: LysR substrate-binding domain-containing protein [Marmoricola sp.]|nr:LysR substrate-binding domain-containing protein [Marmoricola sp.]
MTSFRVAFVPGVTPDKWARIWDERMSDVLELRPIDESAQLEVLRLGEADMCFARLPIDRDQLHLIPLYREVPVVVVSKEHVLSVLDEITTADLEDEVTFSLEEITAKQAVETVATGTGYIVVPMSVARIHHRKDVVARPLVDGEESEIGLAWLMANEDPRIEDFIGIVRGRSAQSSRGNAETVKPKKHDAKPPAKKAAPRSAKRTGSSRQQRRR